MSVLRIACVQLEAHDVAEADRALKNALAEVDKATQADPDLDLIVLPEMTYPGYFLGTVEDYKERVEGWLAAQTAFGEKAAEAGAYLAVGLLDRDEENPSLLYNVLVLYGPDGQVLGKARKSFLWHFDARWFTPGQAATVVETPHGRFGLMICADARAPEVARALAVQEADLIIDVVNLVSSGGAPETLSSPQIDYMLPVRAMENRVWVVGANKVGMESDSVLYCGRSFIIGPDGEYRAKASAHRQETVAAEVNLREGRDEFLGGIHPLRDRKPEEYRLLAAPQEEVPVRRQLEEPVRIRDTALFGAVGQVAPDEEPERIRSLIRNLLLQGAGLIALGGGEGLAAETLQQVAQGLPETRAWIIAGSVPTAPRNTGGSEPGTPSRIADVSKSGIWLTEASTGTVHPVDDQVIELPFGRVAVIAGSEGYLPEVARVRMLRGADIVVWLAPSPDPALHSVARSRASESKIFLMVAGWPGPSFIVSPAGAVIAETYAGRSMALGAPMDIALARNKQVAPGTDVVEGRTPAAYGPLAWPGTAASAER